MAPSHELRERINDVIRERLDSAIVRRAMETERLVSLGCTRAEKALAANYALGDKEPEGKERMPRTARCGGTLAEMRYGLRCLQNFYKYRTAPLPAYFVRSAKLTLPSRVHIYLCKILFLLLDFYR